MQAMCAAEDLVIVSVHMDEQCADADKFFKQLPADFHVRYDPQGMLSSRYQIIGMPSLFLIGRNGSLVAKHQGFFEDSPQKFGMEI